MADFKDDTRSYLTIVCTVLFSEYKHFTYHDDTKTLYALQTLYERNPSVVDGFPSHMDSDAEL